MEWGDRADLRARAARTLRSNKDRGSQTALRARRARTIGMCSLDARSEGRPGSRLKKKVVDVCSRGQSRPPQMIQNVLRLDRRGGIKEKKVGR